MGISILASSGAVQADPATLSGQIVLSGLVVYREPAKLVLSGQVQGPGSLKIAGLQGLFTLSSSLSATAQENTFTYHASHRWT